LFHGSVAENIAYGSFQAASRESVIKAAIAAEAHELAEKLPEGYASYDCRRTIPKLSGVYSTSTASDRPRYFERSGNFDFRRSKRPP
jgi:hypothetical protein